MAEKEIAAVEGISSVAGPSDCDVDKKEAKGVIAPAANGHTRFWSPFTLRFEDDDLEAWFCRERVTTWLETESLAHATALVPSLFTLAVTGKALSPLLTTSLMGTTALCPLLSWWSSKPSYWKHRSAVLSLSRVVAAVQAANVAVSGLHGATSAGSFLGRLVFWGPLAPLVLASTNVRLPFHVHFPAQSTAAALSAFWIQALCARGGSFRWMFESIEDGIDQMMVKMYMPFANDMTRAVELPCYTVIPFMHFVVGFVLPTLLVYALEVHSRAEFLTKVLGSEHHRGIHQFMHDALWFGCWAALFLTQASWLVLSLPDGME